MSICFDRLRVRVRLNFDSNSFTLTDTVCSSCRSQNCSSSILNTTKSCSFKSYRTETTRGYDFSCRTRCEERRSFQCHTAIYTGYGKAQRSLLVKPSNRLLMNYSFACRPPWDVAVEPEGNVSQALYNKVSFFDCVLGLFLVRTRY